MRRSTAIVYTVLALSISISPLSPCPPSLAFAAIEQRAATRTQTIHRAASAYAHLETRAQTSYRVASTPEQGTFQTEDGSIITWTADGDICTVTGFASLTPTLTLPSSINGRTVRYIGSTDQDGRFISDEPGFTFLGCTTLETVFIPNSVNYIAAGAFKDCANLREVTLPQQPTVIEDEMFSGCKQLKTIHQQRGVDTIGKSAFEGCTSLTDLPLFDSRGTTIADRAFFGCTSLNTQYTFPFTSIGKEAFQHTALTTVQIDYAATIGDGAFKDISTLKSIRMVKGLGSAGVDAIGSDVLLISAKYNRELHAFAKCNGNDYIFGSMDDWNTDPKGFDWKTFDYDPHELSFRVVNKDYPECIFPSEHLKIEYRDNVLPGEATCIISSDHVAGSIWKHFRIIRRDVDDPDIQISPIPTQIFQGNPVEPKPIVTYKSRTLTEGVDYELEYQRNDHIGRATVTVSGIGCFSGFVDVPFAIVGPPVTISFDTNGGSPIEPITIDWKDDEALIEHVEATPPSRKYSIFAGWYTNKELTRPWDLYRDHPDHDMTLYAKWNPLPGCRPYGFNDVPYETPHAEHIWWMAYSGISEGWTGTDGARSYRPYQEVARCDMAAFLYRASGSPKFTPSAQDWQLFADVEEQTPHAREILWLAKSGISTGFPDGSFKPYATVTRCDMAAFLHRMRGSLPPAALGPQFIDVNADTPHAEHIAWLSGEGISTGFPDDTFRPYETVVRCDMSAFLHRMQERQ